MTPQTINAVLLALKPDPEDAEKIAERANLGRNQTYQALVHLYDRGLAFLARGSDSQRIAGWTC